MSNRSEEKAFLQSGFILTAVSLISSVIHYLFQAVMGRLLPTDEYGYMNSTLGIVLLASVPLSSASQTVAHYLARLKVEGDQAALESFRDQSLRWLRRATWFLILISLVLWIPTRDFFNFPRNALAIAALIFIPAQLWSVVAGAWCAGSGRFVMLGYLTLGAAIVRLVAGMLLAHFWGIAESGVVGTLIGAAAMGSALFFIPREKRSEEVTGAFPKGFYPFLFASIGVGVGNYLFLQADQIIAQRYFSGIDLGHYSAAGVMGRAVILGSLPFLIVYFTQRSEISATNAQSWKLKTLFICALLGGVGVVYFASELLCRVLLGHVEMQTAQWMDRFALNMLIIGILHALGFFFLATRRIFESVLFGFLGLSYAVLLIVLGKSPDQMLLMMRYATGGILIFILLVFAIRHWGKSKSGD